MDIAALEKRIVYLEESVKKITELEDIETIKKLHRDYISRLDKLQFDNIDQFFIDTATVEIRQKGIKRGRKEIADLYINVLGKNISKSDAHLVGQAMISVDGNKAKGNWTVFIFFSKPSKEWVQGINECEYVKVNGQWKFSSLKFTRILASDESLYP